MLILQYLYFDRQGIERFSNLFAQAVEVLFPGAKVAKVNTISVRGRFRRQGMHAGYTAASKKAIVTLTKDSKEIEFFNSMV